MKHTTRTAAIALAGALALSLTACDNTSRDCTPSKSPRAIAPASYVAGPPVVRVPPPAPRPVVPAPRPAVPKAPPAPKGTIPKAPPKNTTPRDTTPRNTTPNTGPQIWPFYLWGTSGGACR